MSNEYLFFLQCEYMHVCMFCVNTDIHMQMYLGSSIHIDMSMCFHMYVYSHVCHPFIHMCTTGCINTLVTLEGCEPAFHSCDLFINRSAHMKGGIMYI